MGAGLRRPAGRQAVLAGLVDVLGHRRGQALGIGHGEGGPARKGKVASGNRDARIRGVRAHRLPVWCCDDNKGNVHLRMPSMPLPPTPPLFTRRLPPVPHGHADMLALQLGEPPLGGNRVTLLTGQAATQRVIGEAIDAAHDHVNADAALLAGEDGDPGPLLARLATRCRAGVHVNLLHDTLDPAARALLLDAGVHLCTRQPVRRRLLVADGRLGLVSEADDAAQSLLLKVEGPAVQRLQRLFIGHWQRHAGAAMEPARFFPPLSVAGTQRVAIATDESGRLHGAMSALLGAVTAARARITLSSGGRAPTRRLLAALAMASARGVAVDLLLPGAADARRARAAARTHYSRLIGAGVRLWERSDHAPSSEACVIDGLWASLGATSAEPGRMRAAGRADIVVLDDDFAARLEPLLRLQLSVAAPVDPERWTQRRWWQRWHQALTDRLDLIS